MFASIRLTAACVFALATAAPLFAASDRAVGTLITGTYVCSLPGDAAGKAITIVEGAGFTIVNGSSYLTSEGRGTYLRVRDKVTFTSGPFANRKMLQVNSMTLRAIDNDGKRTPLRCTRSSR